jgi:hypothetical protein
MSQILGENSEIANGATARSVEEKEGIEKEMRKEEGGESYSTTESRQPSWRDTIDIR